MSDDSHHIMALLRDVQQELASLREHLTAKSKPLLTVSELAELTGRTPYTVRRWIAEGRIRAERVIGTGPKGRLLVARSEVGKLIDLGHGANVPPASA